jgi:hypothetical protein
MDYKKHYELLISRARNRQLPGYVERHHIIPRCIGGTNDSDNIVNLTPEEHYVAHQLLVKIYPTVDSLVYAANKMTVSSKNVKRRNKRYGWLKRRYQNVCKKRIGDKNPSYGKSWYHCPTSLDNGKFLEKDVPEGWAKGRVPKLIDRYCRSCLAKVDSASNRVKKHILCELCKSNAIKERAKNSEKYNYELIKKIYKEHTTDKIGYWTLAQKYSINKWTIYDYIKRYKSQLEKDFEI